MKLQQTPELRIFAEQFYEHDSRLRPQEPKASHELFMRNGLKYLDVKRRHRLALFLDECLDGTHSEEELRQLWRSAHPQMIIEPIMPFLRDVRARLRGSYAFAPFGPPDPSEVATTLHWTPELCKFSAHFVDDDDPSVGPYDSKQDYERLMANGLAALSAEERDGLAGFLDACLDGTHSEREWQSVWMSTSPRKTIAPIIPFLRDLRARLGGSLDAALFGPPGL